MKALIAEDEQYAQVLLTKLLEKNYPDIEIAGRVQSIEECVAFLQKNSVDILFLDIQLKDGNAFNIFDKINVSAYVIFTTAYDKYAVKAFEHRAVGYLLKPIDEDKFKNLMEGLLSLDNRLNLHNNINKLFGNKQDNGADKKTKQRFVLRYNDKYTIVDTLDIAYFVAENRYSLIVTFDGDKIMCDDPLDKIINEIDGERFFRINRSYIASSESIAKIERYFHGRLRITLSPAPEDNDITISRDKVNEFISWLEMHKN